MRVPLVTIISFVCKFFDFIGLGAAVTRRFCDVSSDQL